MKTSPKGRHVGTASSDYTTIILGAFITAAVVVMLVMDRSAVEIAAVVPMMGMTLGKLRQPRHRASKPKRDNPRT